MIKTILKQWGSEEVIENNELYCLKHLNLAQQHRCSYHHHKIKDETFYISYGQVLLNIEQVEQILKPGDKVRIFPGQRHCFTGMIDSQIIEVSTHDDPEDSYREAGTESRRLTDEEFRQAKAIRRGARVGGTQVRAGRA